MQLITATDTSGHVPKATKLYETDELYKLQPTIIYLLDNPN